MRTLQIQDGTVIVVRQIAAVGPIRQKEKELDEDESGAGNPLPKKRWCIFDIHLVGGYKLYPEREYDRNEIEASRDRNKIVAALETRVNEL